MQLIGRRTYAVLIAIIVLSMCQFLFGLQVPDKVFVALFALALYTLRLAVGNTGKALALMALIIPALLLSGCGTGYRSCSQANLVSIRKPVFMVNGQTNEVPASALSPRGTTSVTVPVGAPVQIYAEQVLVMLWGGSAASNSVLSGIQIPLTP
jgi:hypothetical protein